MIILDLETTGFDAKINKIIEFAAIKVDNKFNIISKLNFLVNPECEIPEVISAIINLYDHNVADKKNITHYIPKIQSFIGDELIVGHNISFDISFLQEHGLALNNKYLDTFDLANLLVKGCESYSLASLCIKLNIPHQKQHRAMHDALSCLKLMKYLTYRTRILPLSFRDSLLSYKGKINSGLYKFLLKNIGTKKQENSEESIIPKLKIANLNETDLPKLPEENYLMEINSLDELISLSKSILYHKQILILPNLFFKFMASKLADFDDILFINSSNRFISESSLQTFLQKDTYDYVESIILFKILLNKAQNLPLNYYDLDISWQGNEIWRKSLKGNVYEYREQMTNLIKENNKSVIIDSLAVLREEFIINPNEQVVCVDFCDSNIDYASRKVLNNKDIFDNISDEEIAIKFRVFCQQFEDYILADKTDNINYSFQRVIDDKDFANEQFQYLVNNLKSLIHLIKNNSTLDLNGGFDYIINNLELFFTYDDEFIHWVFFNSPNNFDLIILPVSYEKILPKLLPTKTSFIFTRMFANDDFSFWEKITGYHNHKKIINNQAKNPSIIVPNYFYHLDQNSDFNADIKNRIVSILHKYNGRILIWCNNKTQITELFLYLSSIDEIKSNHSLASLTISGGKYKILNQLQNNPNLVMITSYKVIDEIILSQIEFDAVIFAKVPFESRKNPVYQVRLSLFAEDSNKYLLNKSILKLQKIARFVPAKEFHIMDSSLKTKWGQGYTNFC